MSPIQTLFLDFGGTLDSDGVHWSTLYARAFAEAGLAVPRRLLDRAFLASEVEFERATDIAYLGLDGHVLWQVRRILDRLDKERPRTGHPPEDGKSSGQPGVQILTGSVRPPTPPGGCAGGLAPDRDLDLLAADLTQRVVLPMRKKLAESRRLLLGRAHLFRFALISNFTENLHVILEQEDLRGLFDSVICSTSVGLKKPDPAIFHLALQRTGAEPALSAMVGDSLTSDIMPARALGMTTFWIRGDRVFIKGDEAAASHEVACLAQALDLCAAAP